MSSHHGSLVSSADNDANIPLEPHRLELSLNQEDGSLRTAPLADILLAATDDLYQDLYNMCHGELTVAAAADNNEKKIETKTERMSNLSFAQRRHELSWRLARHSKTLQHVAALTAGAATTDLGTAVRVASQALQHARTAWVQADEAQDALYFFHAQLFPGRAAPSDVYGACDILLARAWFDLPRDVRLATDPYEASAQAQMTKTELDDVWQMTVRRKLLTGEVGWRKRQEQIQNQQQRVLWKVSLRGGVVKLTHGSAIEAMLTVVPSESPEWTLLSLNVHVHAKTGEFNHQLEPSNRQRYDLHRLAALAMSREEARKRAQQLDKQENKNNEINKQAHSMEIDDAPAETTAATDAPPARPLNALFQVAHRFSLSWQLEVLSAQAQALRRGVWAAGTTNPVQVTPVRFFSDDNNSANKDKDVLGVVSISFWRVDDSYGPPMVENICVEEEEEEAETESRRLDPKYLPSISSQLVLSIQAVTNVGMRVALSGSAGICVAMKDQPSLKATVQELLKATSDPFSLSASDALLAATRLCAERKCSAVVQAIQQSALLPNWITVSVEQGSIVVGARVCYYTGHSDTQQRTSNKRCTTLFRLLCDGRTGSFVPTFSRDLQLLRRLAANEQSEALAIRVGSLPANRRRTTAMTNTSAGRCVRDAVDGLVRCMNVLGYRAAVGGSWADTDSVQSPKLRQRAIQSACGDVKTSLVKCCALSALYGLGPLALAAAVGLDAETDMAGGAMEKIDDLLLVAAPPLSIRLQQELVETSNTTSDGVSTKNSHLEQALFCLSCSVTNEGVMMVPLEIETRLDNPASAPIVEKRELLEFEINCIDSDVFMEEHGITFSDAELQDPIVESSCFAGLLLDLIDLENEVEDEVRAS